MSHPSAERVIVPQSFREQPRWWLDEAGRRWLDDIPRLADHVAARWGLTLTGEVWHGSNAIVIAAERGGQRLALRLSPPGDDVEAEVGALRLWSGRGTVALEDWNVDLRALLLERLDGSRTLAEESVDSAADVIGAMTRRLAVPVPSSVRSTSSIAHAHAVSFETEWERLGRPAPRTILDTAARRAERLAGSGGAFAVDGDLHDGQFLRGGVTEWTVVDPLLLRGDPEYDLARLLWSRFDESTDVATIRATIDRLVDAAGVPAPRAHDWIAVRSMSYLLWGVEHGLTIDPPRCLHILETVA